MFKNIVNALPLPVHKAGEVFLELTTDADRTRIPRSATFDMFGAEGFRIYFCSVKIRVLDNDIAIELPSEQYTVPKKNVRRVLNASKQSIWVNTDHFPHAR